MGGGHLPCPCAGEATSYTAKYAPNVIIPSFISIIKDFDNQGVRNGFSVLSAVWGFMTLRRFLLSHRIGHWGLGFDPSPAAEPMRTTETTIDRYGLL